MILMAKSLSNKLDSSIKKQNPKESDHSFVLSALNLNDFKYGRGVLCCNATLLKNEDIKTRVKEKWNTSLEEPNHWKPHQKLDFIKVKIRDYMIEEGKHQAKKDRSDLVTENYQ